MNRKQSEDTILDSTSMVIESIVLEWKKQGPSHTLTSNADLSPLALEALKELLEGGVDLETALGFVLRHEGEHL